MQKLKLKFHDTFEELLVSAVVAKEKELDHLHIINRRKRAFYRYLNSTVPESIKPLLELDFMDWGRRDIFCELRIVGNDRKSLELSTILLIEWAAELDKWEFKKKFSKYNGNFTYELKRDFKIRDSYFLSKYTIEITNASNVDGCTVKKKRKMMTIYESDCDDA